MNTSNKVISAAKRGFTLVELLVVVAIIGTLAAIVVPSVTKYIDRANDQSARSSVKAIALAVDNYMRDTKINRPPTDLKVLVQEDGKQGPWIEGGEGALNDPWDNEFRIEVKSGRRFAVISNGPDGEPGTDDDIRSDKVEKSKD